MNNRITEKILEDIDELEYEDKLEVLANVFIKLGMSSMDTSDNTVSAKNILQIVMDDIKENGETVANAIVRQGLLILSWLNKEK
mgnify:CR=1 FL=1|tara:strand:+ start:701 stop:952 length:252 start_codon:yes stop_codon:yes gene_type:complete